MAQQTSPRGPDVRYLSIATAKHLAGLFPGRQIAFTTGRDLADDFYTLRVCIEGETGYRSLGWQLAWDSSEVRLRQHADELNRALDVGPRYAAQIIASTMAGGRQATL